jgi:hypothetical protein
MKYIHLFYFNFLKKLIKNLYYNIRYNIHDLIIIMFTELKEYIDNLIN